MAWLGRNAPPLAENRELGGCGVMQTSPTLSDAPLMHRLIEKRFRGPLSPYVVQRDLLVEYDGRPVRIHRFCIIADMFRSLSLVLNTATGLWHVVSFRASDKTFYSLDNLDRCRISSVDRFHVFGRSFGYATIAQAVRKTRAEIWIAP